MSSGFRYYVEVAGRPPIELPEGEISVGRSRSCTVQIPDTTVSRQHVTLQLRHGAVRMKDLGSSNGTFVNGNRVTGEVPIADGDRVIVGEAQMVFRIMAPAAPEIDATMKVDIDKVFAEAIDRVDRAEFHPAAAAAATLPPAAPAMPAPPPPPVAAAAVTQIPSPPARPTPPPRSAAPPVPPPPSPSRHAAPPIPPAPMPPPRAAASPPPLAPAGGGELLSSIKEIELQQVPAPGPRKAAPASARPGAAPAAAAGTPAGFWIRVAQALLDAIPSVLLAIVSVAGAFLRMPILGLLVLPLQLGYAFFLLLYAPATWGATPGMRFLKLAIVSPENRAGQGLGWPKALIRMLGHWVCGLTFGIGYLLVAFTSKKQGLHDMIANTQVVRR